MEVKDVTKVTATDALTLQTADKALDKSSVEANPEKNKVVASQDEVDVAVSTQNVEATEVNDSRLVANAAISSVNVALEGTDKIGKVLKSISGIVDQAVDAPVALKAKFTDEAKGLVTEIANVAQTSIHDSIASNVADKFRVEIENAIGKTLDIIFPGNAKNSYGLQDIELSTKESIISTRSAVAKAVAEYENLRENIKKAADHVRALSTSVDDVAKTKESIQPAVRVVDDAVRLTGDARASIGTEPSAAIGSFGNPDSQVLQ